MNGEIVFTTTEDKVRLHGFYRHANKPSVATSEVGSVDAAIMIHGLGGNFYSSRLLTHFSQPLLELGISVVIVNTRGHDMINTSTWAGRAQSIGAALENVEDSKHDVSAWADFLTQQGHSNLLVFGHSLGAIKALYAQAHQPHPKIRSIIGLSATRLSYRQMLESPRGDVFRATFQHCLEQIKNGEGETPIHVPFPFPTWMTPACYLAKYGPDESFNWIKFIDKVDVPTLLLFGQRELDENPAFEGLRDELTVLRSGWNSLSIEEVREADHFYTSKFGEVENLINRWLTQ
ncbi:MAG: alpha/beta fold hydrolase [Mariniblastus sp.]|nr:alpha/beta fold hydrolase [Mariniblastus sp.]